MTELIVDRIEAAKSRILKETKTVSRKPVYSDGRKGLFQNAVAQPWLCGTMRREATRAAEEAFKENNRRAGLPSPKDGIVMDSISNGDTPSSRPLFSFCYSGTRMARASSAAFPRLCKELFINQVGSCVLARAIRTESRLERPLKRVCDLILSPFEEARDEE